MNNIFALSIIILSSFGCQDSKFVESRQAVERNAGSDGTVGGSGLYFTCENEETAKKQPILQNLAGYARPLCSLLSESSASIAVFQTADIDCDDCVSKLKLLEDQVALLTEQSKKKLIYSATFSKETALAESKQLNKNSGSDAIWMKDHLGMLERFLVEQNIGWSEHPIVFVGTKSIAVIKRSDFNSVEDLIYVAKESFGVVLKVFDQETPQEFSWDGLSNQSSSLWSVRSL